MDRRGFLRGTAGVGAASLTAVAGCLDASAGAPQDYDVGMSTLAFRPERLTVSAGDTVVWYNSSSHAHTVTAYESGIPDDATYFATGDFESETAARDAWDANSGGSLLSGEVYRHTFEVPGEYHYVCIPHERAEMTGTVVVEE